VQAETCSAHVRVISLIKMNLCFVRLSKCGLFGKTLNMGGTCAGRLNIIHVRVHQVYVGNLCIP
jgi:hypothetical protein